MLCLLAYLRNNLSAIIRSNDIVLRHNDSICLTAIHFTLWPLHSITIPNYFLSFGILISISIDADC